MRAFNKRVGGSSGEMNKDVGREGHEHGSFIGSIEMAERLVIVQTKPISLRMIVNAWSSAAGRLRPELT